MIVVNGKQEQKKLPFPAPAGVQFPMAAGKGNFHGYSIKTEEDLVKFKRQKEEEFLMANEQEKNITPEQTAEAAALQAGDFSDEYFNEIAQSLVYAEPPMEEEARAELWKNARGLHADMKSFEQAEKENGADMDAWDAYAARHSKIIKNIEKAGEAYNAGKGDAERKEAVENANTTMQESGEFFRRRQEELLRREKEYQEQIAAMRKELEELKRATQQITPQAMAQCFAAAVQFLEEVDKTRREAKSQPRLIAGELFSEARKEVKEAYYSVRNAPSRIKGYLRQKADKAIDGVLQNVADVFDKGAKSLAARRDAVMAKSPLRKRGKEKLTLVENVYLEVIEQEVKNNHGTRNAVAEMRAAGKLASAGFNEKEIALALKRHSPLEKMKDGTLAMEIAQTAKRNAQEGQQAKGSQKADAAR